MDPDSAKAVSAEMVLLAPGQGLRRAEPYYRDSFSESGRWTLNVVIDPASRDDAVSAALVARLRERRSPFLLVSEEHHELLRFDLGHRTVRIRMEFFLENGTTLASQLPDGVDVMIGSSTLRAIRLAMRQAFLQEPSASELHPIFRKRNSPVDLDFCFVLMPFGEPWSDRVWKRHVKPTVESLGLRCERADDFFAPGAVVDDIWDAITRATVLIADLTGRNPNVFYELGIAHVVGVPAILLSQDQDLAAFDTAHLRQIRYQDNTDGCELLERHLRTALTLVLAKMGFPG
jgi:hypothetical protein